MSCCCPWGRGVIEEERIWLAQLIWFGATLVETCFSGFSKHHMGLPGLDQIDMRIIWGSYEVISKEGMSWPISSLWLRETSNDKNEVLTLTSDGFIVQEHVHCKYDLYTSSTLYSLISTPYIYINPSLSYPIVAWYFSLNLFSGRCCMRATNREGQRLTSFSNANNLLACLCSTVKQECYTSYPDSRSDY